MTINATNITMKVGAGGILSHVDPVFQDTIDLGSVASLGYLGGFNISNASSGGFSGSYPIGVFKYVPSKDTFFYVGSDTDQPLAEFALPTLTSGYDVSTFNDAAAVFDQDYMQPLAEISSNPQGIDKMRGMYYVGGNLIVNAEEYYDAAATNTHTTFKITGADDLSTATFSDFYSITGAAHTNAWISEVPAALQAEIGATHIFGNATTFPIDSRHSIGPSAFAIDIADFSGSPGTISSTALIDYSLANPIVADLQNTDLTNDLYTSESQPMHGFILAGTRTYIVIGNTGGHEFGIGYKITQDTGYVCGGFCPYVAADREVYYWLYDLDDMLDAKNGVINPYDVMPYEYGHLALPYQSDKYRDLLDVDYDATTNRLFVLTKQDNDRNTPSVSVFSVTVK